MDTMIEVNLSRKLYNSAGCQIDYAYEPCRAKIGLKALVIAIQKEGWAGGASPSLLLAWHLF